MPQNTAQHHFFQIYSVFIHTNKFPFLSKNIGRSREKCPDCFHHSGCYCECGLFVLYYKPVKKQDMLLQVLRINSHGCHSVNVPHFIDQAVLVIFCVTTLN